MLCRVLVLVSTLLYPALNSPHAQAQGPGLTDRGRLLYESHCGRCHGDDGDLTDYSGIIPLAGLARRPPVGLVGRFRSNSFAARGAQFSGDRARALALHLAGLRGSKGFQDPGWLWSPYLLDRKKSSIGACRILDVRRDGDYRAGHIPNAVPLELDSLGDWSSGKMDPAELFRQLAIGPLTQVVVYDQAGGPDAAWVWWRLLEAGHPYVAFLDGGWQAWRAAGYEVTTLVPTPPADGYRPAGRAGRICTHGPPRDLQFDWCRLVTPAGLRPAEEVQALLQDPALQSVVPVRLRDSSPRQAAFFVLVLRLVGWSAVLEPDGDGFPLICREPAPAAETGSLR